MHAPFTPRLPCSQVTGWSEQAERFSRIAVEGKTFLLSKGRILMANKRYSTTANNYEISCALVAAVPARTA